MPHTPLFFAKSVQPIENKDFRVAYVVYGKRKSAQGYEQKGVR